MVTVHIDYGAPLKNGVLTSSGRLVCPWHGKAGGRGVVNGRGVF